MPLSWSWPARSWVSRCSSSDPCSQSCRCSCCTRRSAAGAPSGGASSAPVPSMPVWTLSAAAALVWLMPRMISVAGDSPTVVYASLGGIVFILAYDAVRWTFPRRWFEELWRYEHSYKLVSSLFAMLSAFVGNVVRVGQPWSQLLPSAIGTAVIVYFFVQFARDRASATRIKFLRRASRSARAARCARDPARAACARAALPACAALRRAAAGCGWAARRVELGDPFRQCRGQRRSGQHQRQLQQARQRHVDANVDVQQVAHQLIRGTRVTTRPAEQVLQTDVLIQRQGVLHGGMVAG